MRAAEVCLAWFGLEVSTVWLAVALYSAVSACQLASQLKIQPVSQSARR